MNRAIKLSFYPIIVILTYLFCVIRLSYLPNLNILSLIISIMVFIFLFIKGTVIKDYKCRKINLSLYIFAFFALFSAVINMKNVDGTLLYVLKIIDITLLVQYVAKIRKDKASSKILFFISLTMTIITILYDATHPYFAWKNDLNYFIGTKFSVSYNAIASLIFYEYGFKQDNTKKWFYIILVLLSILTLYACSKVECTTGVIGAIICIIFIALEELKRPQIKKNSIFMNPNTSILIFIISAASVLMLEKIISIPTINHFITVTLEKSADLSGRLIVYEKYPSYLKDHILFGYGYNNVYALFKNTMKIGSNAYAYDAQNALLEYILYFGLIGTISFLAFVRNSFKELQYLSIKEIESKKIFVLGFYLLVFIGIVEITIDPLFYLFLSFITCGKETNNKINRE